MQLFPTKMNSIIICFLLLFALSYAGADENTALFINSSPINANIIIDGNAVVQKTPALLTGITAGEHEIKILKDGFDVTDSTVAVIGGTVNISTFTLYNGNYLASFPDEESIILHTDEDKELPSEFRMPDGDYRIEKSEGVLKITPIYPKSGLVAVTGTLFAGALAANLIAIGEQVRHSSTGDLGVPFSTGVIATGAAATILGVTQFALLVDKLKFFENTRFYKDDPGQNENDAQRLFDNAQNAMSAGRLEAALTGFSSLISSHPDFPGFPEALYRIARLHIISGDTNLAITELKIIITDFPDPDIYDKACQTLALMYFNSGEIEKSVQSAENMVFYDPLFADTPSDIENYGIEWVIANWAGAPGGTTE